MCSYVPDRFGIVVSQDLILSSTLLVSKRVRGVCYALVSRLPGRLGARGGLVWCWVGGVGEMRVRRGTSVFLLEEKYPELYVIERKD
jgi:hypothetical protein